MSLLLLVTGIFEYCCFGSICKFMPKGAMCIVVLNVFKDPHCGY